MLVVFSPLELLQLSLVILSKGHAWLEVSGSIVLGREAKEHV